MPKTKGFWDFASTSPEHLALVDRDGAKVSAGELAAASNRLVHGLRARHDMQRGDVLAIVLGNRREFVELYLAAMQAGLQIAPIATKLAAPEIKAIVESAGAKVLVVDGESGERAEAAVAASQTLADATYCVDGQRFSPYALLHADQPETAPPDRWAGSRLLFTGGTTGLPKAIRRPLPPQAPEEAASFAAMHLFMVAGIKPRSGAIHLVTSPMYHSASLAWGMDNLQLGHTLVLMERFDAEGALQRIDAHRVTGTFMVPTHFYRLLSLPDATRARYDVSSLRHVVHGGAACSVEVKRRMLEWWGPIIIEVYGAAEGGGTSIGARAWLEHPGAVGPVGPNIEVRRDDGSRCDVGELGEVFLRAFVPFEYQQGATRGAATQRGEYFSVGDLGYVDDGGYLILRGRRSETVISGGVNVYPAEVEAVLISHPAVRDAAIYGVPDAEWGEQVCAAVELDAPVTVDELSAWCKDNLAAFKCPRHITLLDELPRSAVGKVLRRELRARHDASS